MVELKGIGFTKVGEFWEKTFEDLLMDAITRALEDANISTKSINSVYIIKPISPHISTDDIVCTVSNIIGISDNIISIDCGTNGVMAIKMAAREAAQGKNVMVVGVEKLSDFTSYEQSSIRMRLLGSHFRLLGIPMEALHALLMQLYLKRWKASRESIAKAAEIAGISRAEFLMSLNRFGVSPFQCSVDELIAEVLDE